MCTHKTREPINDLRLYIHLKARSLVAFRLDEQDFHLQQEADISIYSAIYQDATSNFIRAVLRSNQYIYVHKSYMHESYRLMGSRKQFLKDQTRP